MGVESTKSVWSLKRQRSQHLLPGGPRNSGDRIAAIQRDCFFQRSEIHGAILASVDMSLDFAAPGRSEVSIQMLANVPENATTFQPVGTLSFHIIDSYTH